MSRRYLHLILDIVVLTGLVACSAPPVTGPAQILRPASHSAATPATPSVTPSPTVAVASPRPTLTPLPPTATALLVRADVPVLCYHHIRDWTTDDAETDKSYIVPTTIFAAQMDFLDQHGYHTISPDQLVAYLTNGATLPDKPILITFDDGDSSQWTNAIPELRRHHFTATFFIMTVVLDKLYYLTSEQVQALDRMGMTIGAHTWDHHRVTRYTDSDWETQITAPTAQLAQLTGHPIKYFAYPYGLWNDEAIVHLKQAGFVAAFQLGEATESSNPLFTIRRGVASGLWSIPAFQEALDARF
jgi:peptidoglycan/xylan/chitin deacetylase (PgdA/CDA1 family)